MRREQRLRSKLSKTQEQLDIAMRALRKITRAVGFNPVTKPTAFSALERIEKIERRRIN